MFYAPLPEQVLKSSPEPTLSIEPSPKPSSEHESVLEPSHKQPQNLDGEHKLRPAAIAGIVISIVVIGSVLVFVIVFYAIIRRKESVIHATKRINSIYNHTLVVITT